VAFGLYWKRVTTRGVSAGIAAGVGCAMLLVFTKREPFLGLNAGFIALCTNLVITIAISLVTPEQRNGFEVEAAQVAVTSQ
jgi:SSS family solute:Na+ symporter